MNEKCRCYNEAQLADGWYCNAAEICQYKQISKGDVLPRCSMNGNTNGPSLGLEILVDVAPVIEKLLLS